MDQALQMLIYLIIIALCLTLAAPLPERSGAGIQRRSGCSEGWRMVLAETVHHG